MLLCVALLTIFLCLTFLFSEAFGSTLAKFCSWDRITKFRLSAATGSWSSKVSPGAGAGD